MAVTPAQALLKSIQAAQAVRRASAEASLLVKQEREAEAARTVAEQGLYPPPPAA